MKVFYCDHFVLPLPPEHRFPMAKYRLLRAQVTASGLISEDDLEVPPAATDAELLRAHQPGYLQRVTTGTLDRQEVRRIGFPWSPQLVERSRRSVGGTLAACRRALQDGRAVNLAGGTHHAFADHGEGFCVLNDAAVAARALQAEGRVRRVMVIDCDVHQGNGTAAIFAQDPTVFTFSIHGRKNYPFRKQRSDLDVELEDGTLDGEYLQLLDEGLERALSSFPAELAIYLAGADPFHDDRLGRLSLSQQGLAMRDEVVFGHCQRRGLPVAVAMAGGYARRVEDTVAIHFATVRAAVAHPCASMA